MRKGQSQVQFAIVILILVLVTLVISIIVFREFAKNAGLNQRNLAGLFSPGELELIGNSFMAPVCTTLGSTYQYMVESGVRFEFNDEDKDEGDVIRFMTFADVGNRMFLGQIRGCEDPVEFAAVFNDAEDSTLCSVIACTKEDNGRYNCGQERTLEFFVESENNVASQLIHLTAWRDTQGVRDVINSDPFRRGDTGLAQMLDTNFGSYLGSLDVRGTFGGACRRYACITCGLTPDSLYPCTSNMCSGTATGGCWFQPQPPAYMGWGTCNPCPDVNSCSEFTRDQCVSCRAVRNCVLRVISQTESRCGEP